VLAPGKSELRLRAEGGLISKSLSFLLSESNTLACLQSMSTLFEIKHSSQRLEAVLKTVGETSVNAPIMSPPMFADVGCLTRVCECVCVHASAAHFASMELLVRLSRGACGLLRTCL